MLLSKNAKVGIVVCVALVAAVSGLIPGIGTRNTGVSDAATPAATTVNGDGDAPTPEVAESETAETKFTNQQVEAFQSASVPQGTAAVSSPAVEETMPLKTPGAATKAVSKPEPKQGAAESQQQIAEGSETAVDTSVPVQDQTPVASQPEDTNDTQKGSKRPPLSIKLGRYSLP